MEWEWRLNVLAVLLQVGVARLHAEGDRHLGCEVPIRMVTKLKLPHVAVQGNILLMLERMNKKQSVR
jgi:hypothetical protein